MTDGPEIHQVGPHYGVNDFLRRLDICWRKCMEDGPWIRPAEHALKTRMAPRPAADHIMAKMLNDPSSDAIMSIDVRDGRRLGKPNHTLVGNIGQGAVLRNSAGQTEESLFLHDFDIRVERDSIVGTIGAGRMTMARHALERMYEREGVPTGGMPDAIRRTVADVRRFVAYAVHADIALGIMPDPRLMHVEGATPSVAMQLVPCSQGLLVVEVVICAMLREEYDLIRLETRRSGTFARGSLAKDPRVQEIVRGGREFDAVPLHIGRTYLSWDILRPEQRRYAEIFREAAGRVDLVAIERDVFGTRDMHLRGKEHAAPALDQPEIGQMRRLLPDCVRMADRSGGVWTIRPGRV